MKVIRPHEGTPTGWLQRGPEAIAPPQPTGLCPFIRELSIPTPGNEKLSSRILWATKRQLDLRSTDRRCSKRHLTRTRLVPKRFILETDVLDSKRRSRSVLSFQLSSSCGIVAQKPRGSCSRPGARAEFSDDRESPQVQDETIVLGPRSSHLAEGPSRGRRRARPPRLLQYQGDAT